MTTTGRNGRTSSRRENHIPSVVFVDTESGERERKKAAKSNDAISENFNLESREVQSKKDIDHVICPELCGPQSRSVSSPTTIFFRVLKYFGNAGIFSLDNYRNDVYEMALLKEKNFLAFASNVNWKCVQFVALAIVENL